jgi:hypothetical protein
MSPLLSKSLFSKSSNGIEMEAATSASSQSTLNGSRSAAAAAFETMPAIPSA